MLFEIKHWVLAECRFACMSLCVQGVAPKAEGITNLAMNPCLAPYRADNNVTQEGQFMQSEDGLGLVGGECYVPLISLIIIERGP